MASVAQDQLLAAGLSTVHRPSASLFVLHVLVVPRVQEKAKWQDGEARITLERRRAHCQQYLQGDKGLRKDSEDRSTPSSVTPLLPAENENIPPLSLPHSEERDKLC